MSIKRNPKEFEGKTTSDFIAELQAFRNKYPYGHHPIIDAMCEGTLPKEGLKTFLIQWWYFGAVGAEQIFAMILAGMPIDPALYPIKKSLVENIHGEFFDPDVHPEVNVNMITSGCGITREEVYTAELLPETSAFVNTLLHYVNNDWKEGLMSLMWALESQSPIQFVRQGKALREQYGFTDTQFVDMHVLMDQEHAEEADTFAEMILTPDNMQGIWNAATDTIEAIWMWHERMYQRFMPVEAAKRIVDAA